MTGVGLKPNVDKQFYQLYQVRYNLTVVHKSEKKNKQKKKNKAPLLPLFMQ